MKKILLFIFLFACLCGRSQVVNISDTNTLRNYINTVIVNNNTRGITAQNFNNALNGFLNTLFPNDSISLATGAANDTLFYWKNRVKKFYVLLRVGGGPGSVPYAGLTDVALTTLSDGQLAKWNATTSKWNNFTIDKSFIGLPLVENTQLSTWHGSSNLNIAGTITSGIWNASPIGDPYISSAANWNAKQSAITLGTPSQYFKGDLTLGTFSPSTVGLGNVQNLDQTNATNLTSGSIPAGRYGNATIPISALGASGGSSTDYLRKDGTWASPPAGASAYSSLTDVAITSIAAGQLVKWNNTASKWNNFTPAAGDVTGWLGYTPMNPTGTTLQYWRGNGTLATFPTDLSSFANGPGYLSGTVTPAVGGSGLTTYSPYYLLAAGTTSTGNYQQISPGTAGQILTSNGPGALPSMQNPGTVSSFASLTDVAITSIAAGQLARWNSGTSKWNNFTPAAGDVTGWLGYTPMNPTGTTSQYWKGNGTLGTFPSNVSFFINDQGYIKAVDSAGLWVQWARLYNTLDSTKTINDAKYRTQTDTSYLHFLQTRARGQQIADSLAANIARNYLPLTWNTNQVIAGGSNVLHIISGSIMADMPSLHERISLSGNNITLWDSTYGQGGSLLVIPNKPGFYAQQSATVGHGVHVSMDSVSFGDDAPSTASYIFLNGGAKFQGHVTGILESLSDSSLNLISTAGVKRLLANYTPGLGSARVGPLDSLTRTSAALQIVNNTILAQTANASFAGMESASHWAETDSLIRRLLKSTIGVGHAGAGKWSGYTTVLGDSLYFKNLNVSTDLTLNTQADSSLLFGVNFGTVVGLTNSQTLTNKILTSPRFNIISTTGYVWTATDALGNGSWQASAGGVGSQNLGQSRTATTYPLTISGGTGTTLLGADHTNAGIITAATQARIDSLIIVNNSGHGHGLLRAPSTKDSLIAKGVDIVAGTGGVSIDYIGNKDSAAWRINFTGVGAGTVTSVNTSTTATSALFTATGGPITTNGTFTFGLANATANTIWGSVAGGTPGYFNPALTSSLFANEGTATTVLHGCATCNPSFGAVNMLTDVTGTLQAAQFPALTGGDVTTTAGSLIATIGAGRVTNAMLAGSIDLAAKVTGIGSPVNGFTGVNNGAKTITLGGNLITSGASALTLTTLGVTNATLPLGTSTLLATNGSGASLTNIPLSATGTANQVLVNSTTGTPQTGVLTFTLPQSIGTGNAPTFTGMTLTGLGAGANTDGIVTQVGGVFRTISTSTLFGALPTSASGQFTPATAASTNTSGLSINGAHYIRSGNEVHAEVWGTVTAASNNAYSSFELGVPVATGAFTNNADAVGHASISANPHSSLNISADVSGLTGGGLTTPIFVEWYNNAGSSITSSFYVSYMYTIR